MCVFNDSTEGFWPPYQRAANAVIEAANHIVAFSLAQPASAVENLITNSTFEGSQAGWNKGAMEPIPARMRYLRAQQAIVAVPPLILRRGLKRCRIPTSQRSSRPAVGWAIASGILTIFSLGAIKSLW